MCDITCLRQTVNQLGFILYRYNICSCCFCVNHASICLFPFFPARLAFDSDPAASRRRQWEDGGPDQGHLPRPRLSHAHQSVLVLREVALHLTTLGGGKVQNHLGQEEEQEQVRVVRTLLADAPVQTHSGT